MARPDPSAAIEEKVQAVTRMPLPDPNFVETLWGKMELNAGHEQARSHVWWAALQKAAGFFHTIWQLGAPLAGLAVLIGLLVFGMKLLPPAAQPGQSTETAVASAPVGITIEDSSVPPTSTPLPAPIPSRLVDGACRLPVSRAFNGQYQGQANPDQIEQLLGGGSAKNGDFNFEIWLACGKEFGRQAYVSSHYSEIEGLGLLAGWTYQGADQEGETLDYEGFEPFIQASSWSGTAISVGSAKISITGLQFPVGIIPDFSRSDIPLRYVIKVRTPDGKLSGAALTFTLQRQPEGYKPVDIQVSPLSEEDLQTAESPALAQPSFPTLDPEALYPELKPIRELVNRYQDNLHSSPGWLYMKTRNENPGGNSVYGGLAEWTSEAWLQIDADGYVIAEVHVDHSVGGQLLQQSYSKDGRTTNLTLGTGGLYTSYRLNLFGQLFNDLFNQLQAGKPIDRQEITVDGRKAWAFIITEPFTTPVSIDNVMTVKLTRSTVIDQQSGAELYSQLLRTTAEGPEQLVWRQTVESIERFSQLPEEVQAILGQTSAPYRPPAPQGTPVPEGFDPTQSELSLQSIPGDNFLVTSNTSEWRVTLRWLDLHDVNRGVGIQ